jgi:chromosome partitioning protein
MDMVIVFQGVNPIMKVIMLLNEKGGVGKTTMAATIGSGLAMMGYRVLLIDADPQGHLTLTFGLKKQHSLYDLLVRDADFNDPGIVIPISPESFASPEMRSRTGKLFILPGNRETRLIAQALESELFAIRNKMAELEEADVVDVVIFDTSPTPSAFHALVFLATQHIIYPTEVNYLSFDGLVASIQSTTGYSKKKLESGLEEIRLTGIIPTKFRANTLEHQEKFKALKKGFGDLVWHPMPQSVIWEEAVARQKTIFSYAHGHPVVSDAWKVVMAAKGSVMNE